MRHTLRLLMIGAAMPLLAGAQVQPARPLPPERPLPAERPERPARPAPSPRPLIEPRLDFDFNYDLKYDLKLNTELLREQALEMAELARHDFRFDAERVREEARQSLLNTRIDVERVRHEAIENLRNTRFDFDFAPAISAVTSAGVNTYVGGGDRFNSAKPRAPWASEDPADSLYRVAREAISRGEYRRAAQLFNEVVKKYPRSTYAVDSGYWEAFARYRSGTTEDLRTARKILEDGKVQFTQIRNHGEGNVDVDALLNRVLGALAARGDEDATRVLRSTASQRASSCDREEISIKAEALGALAGNDPAAALPIVKRVLANRDDCTVELRRRALYIVGRQTWPDGPTLMLDVAKNDPDNGIRGEAMRWLPRIAGDAAVPQLEDLLKTSTDEQTQRMAVSALGSIDSERARRAIRTIIERNDAGERIRQEAILTLSREREGRSPSAEEQAYVRQLYGKLESQRLREATLTAIGRNESAENQAFLLAIVRNQNEAPSLRSTALSRLGRMNSVTAAEIAKLYDVADTRSLREQILNSLSQRKEDEAVDKMIEIGKRDTDPQIRRYAIMLLSRSSNERAKQFIKDMWNQ